MAAALNCSRRTSEGRQMSTKAIFLSSYDTRIKSGCHSLLWKTRASLGQGRHASESSISDVPFGQDAVEIHLRSFQFGAAMPVALGYAKVWS